MPQNVISISKVDRRDIDVVGKYAAELGELSRINIPIPRAFVVTTNCFREFLMENRLYSIFPKELQIMQVPMSRQILKEIYTAYKELGNSFKENKVVVTPSSPFSNFENIHHNLHYEVRGDANLILKIKQIWAAQFSKISLLETKARQFNNMSRLDIAIVVQKKVDQKTGTMFTEDPETSDKTKIVIEQDEFEHSHYVVSKRNFNILFKSHLTHVKKSQMISHEQVQALSHLAVLLQKHFYFPQKIKFSIDKNIIYILETKPMTHVMSKPPQKSHSHFPKHHQQFKRDILLKGICAFPGIATGPVKVFKNTKDIYSVNPSEILVISKVERYLFPKIKKAKGLITEIASLTGHDKMIYRKIVAKPIIQGAKNATSILHTGIVVTVNGATGEVYKGGFN